MRLEGSLRPIMKGYLSLIHEKIGKGEFLKENIVDENFEVRGSIEKSSILHG